MRVEKCEQKNPPLLEVAPGHDVACWFWEEVRKDRRAADRSARRNHGDATATAAATAQATTLLEVNNLVMHFPLTQGIIFQRKVGAVQAVDGVSFDVKKGETLGLVGESGCGKSTTGRAILQLYKPTAGEVVFKGKDLTKLDGGEMRKMRRHLQMIFQDPYASLNPRMTVGNIIAEPMQIHNLVPQERAQRARAGAAADGRPEPVLRQPLPARVLRRPAPAHRHRPRAGGEPASSSSADEPVSALDVSIQAQIVNLLEDLQEQFGLTYLFIAHDLSVVRHISDRVAVMYLGKIVELADRNELYERPAAPVHQGAALGRADPGPGDREASASGSSSPATCRARSTRRPAATSTRAART